MLFLLLEGRSSKRWNPCWAILGCCLYRDLQQPLVMLAALEATSLILRMGVLFLFKEECSDIQSIVIQPLACAGGSERARAAGTGFRAGALVCGRPASPSAADLRGRHQPRGHRGRHPDRSDGRQPPRPHQSVVSGCN